MYIKITKSGPRRYVQLVDSFRDGDGRARQRTVANFGRLEQMTNNVESIVKGLLKATGNSVPEAGVLPPAPHVSFDSARSLGDVWALTNLWNELGFDALKRVFRKGRHKIDIEALLRIWCLIACAIPNLN
jgi:hypothetical protein